MYNQEVKYVRVPLLTSVFEVKDGIVHYFNGYDGGQLCPIEFWEKWGKYITVPKIEKSVAHELMLIPADTVVSGVLYLRNDIIGIKEAERLGITKAQPQKPRYSMEDAKRLKNLRGLMDLTAEQCDPLVAEWSKGKLTSHLDITEENIKAFNKFLEKKAIEKLGAENVTIALEANPWK
jgi:hypothetical protein